MGFAEQLAARAAERQSKSSGNSVASISSSSTAVKKKKRRPRIQPVSDEEFAAISSGGVAASSGAVGGNTREDASSASKNSFADPLNVSSIRTAESATRKEGVSAPILAQMKRLEHESHEQQSDHSTIDIMQTRASMSATNNTRIEQQIISAIGAASSLTNKNQANHINHQELQSSRSDQLSNLQVVNDQERRSQPVEAGGDNKPTSIKSSGKHNHNASTPESICATSQVFGAWAQIESLQLRLKEAEERAARECRRADELAELKNVSGGGFGGGVASKILVNEVDESYVGVLSLDTMEESTTKQSLVGGDGSGAVENRVYKVEDSGESLETVALVSEEDARKYPSHVMDNDELRIWKQRALEAEERLSRQHDHSTLISPSTTNDNTLFQSPQHKHHHPHPPAVESDLIQLKNNEISILRHQISRLELRIQEECARNSELLHSYHQHHHEPPIAVAECTPALSGENNEFRMLRNEIRQLQYQLSKANNGVNNNRSTQSTTGSTLSSLENEHEEEEEDGNDGGQHQEGSSWLCCVRRSRRGYGRVTR